MKGPSLQKTTAFSALIHLTIFLLAFLIIRQNNRIVLPSPYTVQLVSPEKVVKRGRASASPSQARTVSKKAFKSKVAKPVLSKKPSLDKSHEKRKEESVDSKVSKPVPSEKPSLDRSRGKRKEESVDDAINRIKENKLSKEKKIRTIALSKQITALGRSGEAGNTPVPGDPTGEATTKGNLFDSYYHKITAEIWQEWIYPDIVDNNLETVIVVKITKDGTIKVEGVEKKSSNILFDRSALKALAKASPVSPPPYEMEIGIRFYP